MQARRGGSGLYRSLVRRLAARGSAGCCRARRSGVGGQARAKAIEESSARPTRIGVGEQSTVQEPLVRLARGARLVRIDGDRAEGRGIETNRLAGAGERWPGDDEASQQSAAVHGNVARGPMLMVRRISSVLRPKAIGRSVSTRTAVS